MGNKTVLNINTTAVTIPIVSGDKEIGSFTFNPTDLDIARRYDVFTEELEKLELSEDATLDDIYALSDKVRELVNYLLGFNCADDIFKVCNPLSPCDGGELFVSVVMDGILEIINEYLDIRIKAKTARIKKATAKYTK